MSGSIYKLWTKFDVKLQLSLAEKFISELHETKEAFFASAECLSRCQPPDYWAPIEATVYQDEAPYLKGNGGHRESTINGRISGLFFNPCSAPKRFASAFGSVCYLYKATDLIDTERFDLFFADFYCRLQPAETTKAHRITLLVVHKTSQYHRFCVDHLAALSWTGNRIFWLERSTAHRRTDFSVVRAGGAHPLQVELFIVGGPPISLKNGRRLEVAFNGVDEQRQRLKRHSRTVGQDTDVACCHCNWLPVEKGKEKPLIRLSGAIQPIRAGIQRSASLPSVRIRKKREYGADLAAAIRLILSRFKARQELAKRTELTVEKELEKLRMRKIVSQTARSPFMPAWA